MQFKFRGSSVRLISALFRSWQQLVSIPYLPDTLRHVIFSAFKIPRLHANIFFSSLKKILSKLPKLSNIYALQFLIDFFDPRCFHLDFEYFSASQFLAYSFLYKYSDAFTCH